MGYNLDTHFHHHVPVTSSGLMYATKSDNSTLGQRLPERQGDPYSEINN